MISIAALTLVLGARRGVTRRSHHAPPLTASAGISSPRPFDASGTPGFVGD